MKLSWEKMSMVNEASDWLKNNDILLKFGREDHLEALKAGLLYFNPVSKYRGDGTTFRGDKNEGKIPIDPSTFYIDGKNFSNLIVSVMQGFEGDGEIFMFCASLLTEEILLYQDNEYMICDEFKKAIRPFGDYVFVVRHDELIYRLREARHTHVPKYGYRQSPILYRDLSRFDTDEYRESYKSMYNNTYDRFFIKSIDYKAQNEWRLIIDGSEECLQPNNGDAFVISVGAFETGSVFQSDVFIETFRIVTKAEG